MAMVFQRDTDLLGLAVQHYEAAVNLRSDAGWMVKNLGQAYAALGRWNDAAEAYQKGLARAPGDATLLNDIRIAWEHLGSYERAVESYRAAILANPYSGQAHNNLGQLLWKFGRLDEAIDEFRQAIGVQPVLAVAATIWD